MRPYQTPNIIVNNFNKIILKHENVCTYLIFSSWVPRVSNTSPQKRSLKEMPRCWPPQAPYNQSASTDGTPSDNTSCKNAFLLSVVPPEPDDFLNASRIRRISLSDTARTNEFEYINKNCYMCLEFYIKIDWRTVGRVYSISDNPRRPLRVVNF